jgi:deglycase
MRIACLIAAGFEDSEFRVPYDHLRAAGHEVKLIGFTRGDTLHGERGREIVRTDLGIDDVAPLEFDALFIPGGHSPDSLRADPRMVAFTRGFRDKPILTICHGPQLLITADLVRGRTLTAWKTIQADLRCCGAHVLDRAAVVDGNLVTSRSPADLDHFVRESLALLERGAETHP